MNRLLLIAIIAACHGDPQISAPPPAVATPEPADGARSGSRLKLVLWQSGDGFTVWTDRFFDARLGDTCQIVPWTDGRTYCTPGAALQIDSRGTFDPTYQPTPNLFDDAPGGFVGYTDDRCTEPVLVATAAPPRFAATWIDDSCPGSPAIRSLKIDRLYRTGARRPPPVWLYRYDPTEKLCAALTQDTTQATVYTVAAEPAPAELVAISQRAAAADRITTTYHVSDDGMQYPAGAHDARFDADCKFSRALDGTLSCVPVGAVSAAFGGANGSDMGCDRPVATVPDHCPRPPAMFDNPDAPGDFDPPRFFPVGEPATQLCPQTPPAEATSYFHLRDPVPLVGASVEREHVADRRLELLHTVVGAWTVRRDNHGLHDNQYGLDCELTQTGPRSAYCSVRPSCGGFVELYLEPGCTTKVRRFDNTGCAEPPPALDDRHTILADQRLEAETYNIVQTGPSTSRCKAAGRRTLYGLAPDLIPLDRFEQFTAVVDPE